MSEALRIQWRDAVDSSGPWRTLHRFDVPNEGFVEARRYLLSKPVPNVAFHVDDEPLSDDTENQNCWSWAPGFYAGEVTAELTAPDGSALGTFLLDVAPDPAKLGRDVFAAMLRDLWQEAPHLIFGEEPAMTAICEIGAADDPWLAFARLRRYGEQAARALAAIRQCPRRGLRVRRELTPLQSVRRMDRRTLSVLPRCAAAVPALRRTGDLLPNARFDVPKADETLDCAANRAMLALQLAMLRRIQTVVEELGKRVSNEASSETRSPLRARWPRRRAFLLALEAHVKQSVRSLPWRDVVRAEVSAAGLTSIAADPVYSRAWSLGWRALRIGMDQGDSEERLWISPSWEIYERWCFIQMGKLLAHALPGWRRKRGDSWIFEQGECTVRLELQPTFPAGPVCGSERRWSVSKQRVPDLMLTVRRPGCLRFLLLDAKYRSSRANVLDAMTSAHVYCDSLRIGAQRPEGAVLLVPGADGTEHLQDPSFQCEHRVGVAIFRPADVVAPYLVTEFLEHWAHK
jgi:hypothetical protein